MTRTILLAAALAFCLGWFGPALDDYSMERDQARALEDAQRAAQARARFERAAQAMCGIQAAWQDMGNGVVQCLSKRGRLQARVSVGGAQQ